jgi:hypothetical protein
MGRWLSIIPNRSVQLYENYRVQKPQGHFYRPASSRSYMSARPITQYVFHHLATPSFGQLRRDVRMAKEPNPVRGVLPKQRLYERRCLDHVGTYLRVHMHLDPIHHILSA